jgi:hypothetical protein
MGITDWASQPEIDTIAGATFGKGDDVFNLEACHHQMLRAAAVSTAMARSLANLALKLSSNTDTWHGTTQSVLASHARRQF